MRRLFFARASGLKGQEPSMKMRVMLGASLVALMAVAATGYAAEGDKPATIDKPVSTKAEAKDVKGVRLIKPFSDLKDLTADETIKLKEIHKKIDDQIKALLAQQKDEMMAVLTDDQKKEVAELEKAPKGKAKDAAATAGQPKDPAKDPAK